MDLVADFSHVDISGIVPYIFHFVVIKTTSLVSFHERRAV